MSKKLTRYMPKKMEIQIKKMLNLRSIDKLPRCKAKCRRQAKRLAEAGDEIHLELEHPVCNDCQCPRTAGWGTKGFFWGKEPEWERYGHYGVGYCIHHEMRFGNKEQGWEFARRHMKALQQYGQAMTVSGDYELMIVQEAEEAQEAEEVRENITALQDYLRDFRELLDDDSGHELTEKCGKDVVPMTFATKAKLYKDLSLGISSLAKDRFFLSSMDYVSVDEIKLRIPPMFSLVHRCLDKLKELTVKGEKDAIDQVRYEFKEEFKNIWTGFKRGVKK